MGRLILVTRLAVRDLRHRPGAAVLLLIALVTATATLTLGLILHGTTSQPYATTKAATNGPDIVARFMPDNPLNRDQPTAPASLQQLTALVRPGAQPKVSAYSGPFPFTFANLTAGGHTGAALVEGRGTGRAAVDQPELTQGSWVRPGGVVIERSFADALGVRAGDPITLNGRTFTVAGIAVSAAIPAYPNVCWFGCYLSSPPLPSNADPGLVWLTEPDARSLVTAAEPVEYVMDIKLADPSAAEAFANSYDSVAFSQNSAPDLLAWQDISAKDAQMVSNEQKVLSVGSWLLGLLALASVVVLVGGRMAAQIRRVGLLKAAGGSPGLVAAVLLAEHIAVALISAALGLLIGWLTAPLLASPGAGLVGVAGAPAFTPATAGLVIGAALGVAVLATAVPAIRAARISTVGALVAGGTRSPRRRALLIKLSARLPVPLLLALRLMARRPRRVLLSTVSILVTGAGFAAVLFVHARIDQGIGAGTGLNNPQDDRLSQVMLLITVVLSLLAAVNALLITWATVLDARHTCALARALGATPRQISAGLATAQVLPALAGALLGIPAGAGLVEAVGGNGDSLVMPPLWWLAAAVLGIVAGVGVITFVPSWIGASRPPAEALQSEVA
jgi:ABC-type antimicrobial peptide transport system permease subunit